MQSLAMLLASAEGRSFLEAQGVFIGADGVVDRLRPPAQRGLGELVGLAPDRRLVYVAQQTHVDFRRSVVSKFCAARDLSGGRVSGVLLWLDMDRSGSDRASTTIAWRLPEGEVSMRLVPQRLRNLEPRFVPMEPLRGDQVVAELRVWIDRSLEDGQQRGRAHERLRRLAEAFLRSDAQTLARANLAIASHLLREQLRFQPPSALVSELASRGLLSDALNDVLANIDDFTAAYNRAIDELVAADVDPQVRPLGHRYLSLHYSCDRCGARRRLAHQRSGSEHTAVATCSCGARYRFHLGTRSMGMGELEATARWSTDVTLPIYLNGLASAVVTGRSSTLYGLVLNQVLEKVLGRTPIPMIVPSGLSAVLDADLGVDSLLHDHLVGT